MEEIPKISEAEWQVMKLLWNSSPLTSEKIIQSLSPKHRWSEQTIKTFITRLVNKEVISYEKKGRTYYYYPLYSKDDYIKSENKDFLKRVYDGALGMLLTKFLEDKDLSMDQIEQLERVLKEKRESKSSDESEDL